MIVSAMELAARDCRAEEGTDRSGVRRLAAARRAGGHFSPFANGTMLEENNRPMPAQRRCASSFSCRRLKASNAGVSGAVALVALHIFAPPLENRGVADVQEPGALPPDPRDLPLWASSMAEKPEGLARTAGSSGSPSQTLAASCYWPKRKRDPKRHADLTRVLPHRSASRASRHRRTVSVSGHTHPRFFIT